MDYLLSNSSSSTYNNITVNEDNVNVNGKTTKITSTKATSIFNDCDELFELLLMNTLKIGYKMWMTTKFLTHKQKLRKKRCASSSSPYSTLLWVCFSFLTCFSCWFFFYYYFCTKVNLLSKSKNNISYKRQEMSN